LGCRSESERAGPTRRTAAEWAGARSRSQKRRLALSHDARIADELAQIARQNGGLVFPAKVVEFAKDQSTALHSRFIWDDTEAARRYRLDQAREIIRVNVTVISKDAPPVRAFVSLSSDRKAGGGYRALVDVLSDDVMMQRLLDDALAELEALKRKYEQLAALRPIWAALGSLDRGEERRAS
jgi:hypothetical protein